MYYYKQLKQIGIIKNLLIKFHYISTTMEFKFVCIANTYWLTSTSLCWPRLMFAYNCLLSYSNFMVP